MQRVYSVYRPGLDIKNSYSKWIKNDNQKLSVSSRGLAAFTTSLCLNQSSASATSHHVYVADINTPYQPYLLVDSEYEFTIVEWDPSGTKLLVCDVRGRVTIYTSNDYIISDWKPSAQHVFAAETFISAAWFHPGIVSSINIPNQNLKNPSNHLEYSDKVQQESYGATLRLFGSKSAEGCVLISRTGLLCCLTILAEGKVDVISESLAPLRTKIEAADISQAKDGSLIVGTSAGTINSTISFYKVQLHYKSTVLDEVDLWTGGYDNGRRISITCKQFTSFHLNIMSQILDERDNSSTTFENVSNIKFVTGETSDGVLVEISGQNLSLIELWELEARKPRTVHGAIIDLNSGSTEDVKPNLDATQAPASDEQREWCFKGNYIAEKELVAIQTPKFRLFGSHRQQNIILLAYSDATIAYVRKEDLQPIGESLDLSQALSRGIDGATIGHGKKFMNNPRSSDDLTSSPYKMSFARNGNSNAKLSSQQANSALNLANRITDIQFTCNLAAIVVIDSLSQMHVVSLPPLVQCQDHTDLETYSQYLLEYSLITGNDWWDVLISARLESIESICDKFYDAYERQPKHIRFKYSNRQLMTRASLYRCVNTPASLCRASDCHTMIMLNSIASTLKSVLRSLDQDSPSERLTNYLKSAGNLTTFEQCQNVMANINEKELGVEVQLIHNLQPLCQWVVDLAIYLIVSLPQRVRQRLQMPGAGLAHNREALELIRELLVIIRAWDRICEINLFGVYKLKDQQVNVLVKCFQLISMMSAAGGDASACDEALVEECHSLANNISIAQFNFVLEPVGVASSLMEHLRAPTNSQSMTQSIATNRSHLTLEYFREPKMLRVIDLPKVDGSINMNGERKIDIVRNISLGAHPVANMRHCTRCKSVSLAKSSSYVQATRAWEQRWINQCVCGGSWAQSDMSSSVVDHRAFNFNNKVQCLANLFHQEPIMAMIEAE